MKRTTIKDIARLLSLSPSTVSRALADHPDISDKTKTRVREVAQSLNYIPNFRARYLRAKHSRLVALILPEVNMFFVPSLMEGISQVLQQNDYSLVVFQSEDSIVQERKLVQVCLNLSIDGVLLALSSETSDLAHLDAFVDSDVPLVLLDKIIETQTHSTVAIDDRSAALEATQYLLERGHTSVAGIFADDRLQISRRRAEGFHEALRNHGIEDRDERTVFIRHLANFDPQLTPVVREKEPTGIFVMSDELLVRTHYFMQASGKSLPEEISLVAMSDGHAAKFLYPPITHWKHSGREVGEKATRILIGMLQQHYAGAALSVTVNTEFVEGRSVSNLSG